MLFLTFLLIYHLALKSDMIEQNCLPFLPHNYRISFQVVHVNGVALGNDVGMRRRKKPPYVCEKETSSHVMGVRVGFAVFVMYSMIQRPRIYISLYKKNIVKVLDKNTVVLSRVFANIFYIMHKHNFFYKSYIHRVITVRRYPDNE